MEGCRPLVGFDGCHLKSAFGGQLLAAVGIDPNERMYPIAWAIVQAKNYDNWLWFMNLLKADINIENDAMWTFISDKQKGLINAVETIFPEAEHRAITRSADTLVEWSGGPKFLVTSTSGGYEMVVDTFNKTCACNKWQLSGIPCFHAVACYHSRNIDPVQGIHPSYSRDMYLKVYEHILQPINGAELWESTPYPKPLPPNVKTAPGRPKKRSRKNDIPAVYPTKLKRENTTLRCGHCKEYGHNKRTCSLKKSDGKVKEKEVAEASGKNNETGGITGTNEASENNEQVEISQGVSQHVDNLQESQEPIVQPTP
ncbi:hypothetical protein DCAR_0623542 [Daucus carota subsp. sativus]|uniref:SWIM-type domain-containing protein n=1 Tax=Daucus carota subsp. sativus TaxID=79200 RepID=A0AAF0XBY0_DAUCS|nr:PREDICTED: uncharacterized protein LOC108225908 [Daucus carota subsp. sativus]WOH04134.1 hypothetical protein DCAR_0623542 [Daucus carota subsp. sativus]